MAAFSTMVVMVRAGNGIHRHVPFALAADLHRCAAEMPVN